MIAKDACKPTFSYSRQRNNEQSTHVKEYCSPDITLYKDCAIKKKGKFIDQQYDHNIIKYELRSNQPSVEIHKPKTVNIAPRALGAL